MTLTCLRSPGRPKDESKRIALLKAARELLLDRGVDVTTDEVAAAAGVAKSTLYAHFKNKDDLVEAVIQHESQLVIADSVIHVVDSAAYSKVIRDFGIKYVHFVNQTNVAGWDRLIAHGAKRSPGLARRFYEAGPGRWHKLLIRLLEHGVNLGLLGINDADQAAEDLCALWIGSSSLQVKLGVALPIDDAGIIKKAEHGLLVFNAFYGRADKGQR